MGLASCSGTCVAAFNNRLREVQTRSRQSVCGLIRNMLLLHIPVTTRLSLRLLRIHMTEVLIVGGGVFGLSTALSLARGKYRHNPKKILVIGAISAFRIAGVRA